MDSDRPNAAAIELGTTLRGKTKLKTIRVVKVVCQHYGELVDILKIDRRILVKYSGMRTVWRHKSPSNLPADLVEQVRASGIDPAAVLGQPSLGVNHGSHVVVEYLGELPEDETLTVTAARCCPRTQGIPVKLLQDLAGEYASQTGRNQYKVVPLVEDGISG